MASPLTVLQWLAIVIFVPLFVAALPLIALLWALDILHIHIKLLFFCAPHGQRALFVYSNSPNWQEYCEREILPALPENAVVLNWSGRATWGHSFPTRLFKAYAGDWQFNPIGIVFRPFKRAAIFRFWQPFRDAKHGKPQKLERLKAEFLRAARQQRYSSAPPTARATRSGDL